MIKKQNNPLQSFDSNEKENKNADDKVEYDYYGPSTKAPLYTRKDTNLSITHLEYTKDDKFELTTPLELSLKIPGSDKRMVLTNIEWGPLSTDIACFDSEGNLTILLDGLTKFTDNNTNNNNGDAANNNGSQPTAAYFGKVPINGNTYQLSAHLDFVVSYQDIISKQIDDPSINLMTESFKDVSKNENLFNSILDDCLTSVAGFKWLNVDKPVFVHSPAIKVETSIDLNSVLDSKDDNIKLLENPGYSYSYVVHQFRPNGAMHPISSRQALIMVRRNGEVCLWYQVEGGFTYSKTTTILEDNSNSMSDGWITQASFGFTSDHSIIVAAYYGSVSILKIYQIVINWNYTQTQQVQGPFPTRSSHGNNNGHIDPKIVAKRLLRERISTIKFKDSNILNVSPLDLNSSTSINNNNLNPDDTKMEDIDILMNSTDNTTNNNGIISPINTPLSPSLALDKLYQKYWVSQVELISPNYNPDSELDILVVLSNGNNSILLRYQINEQQVTLHNSFNNYRRLNQTSSSSGSSLLEENYKTLSLKDLMYFKKPILKVSSQGSDIFLSFVLSDGTIEFRNRGNLQKLSSYHDANDNDNNNENEVEIDNQNENINNNDTMMGDNDNDTENNNIKSGDNHELKGESEIPEVNTFNNPTEDIATQKRQNVPVTISSLFDVGFIMPKSKSPSLATCISPNLTSYVTIPVDGKTIELYSVSRSPNKLKKNNEFIPIASAISFRHAVACFASSCTDDLLLAVKKEYKRLKTYGGNISFFRDILLQESHRSISFSLDSSRDQIDKYLANPPLQRLFSFQLILGSRKNFKRDLSGRIAWSLLNLRVSALGIMITLKSLYHYLNKMNDKTIPETENDIERRWSNTIAVLGLVKWSVDFIAFLNQELIDYYKDYEDENGNLEGCLATSMILGKAPRSLLLFTMDVIMKMELTLRKTSENRPYPTSNDARSLAVAREYFSADVSSKSYKKIRSILDNSPINLSKFQLFVNAIDINSRQNPPDLSGNNIRLNAIMIEQRLLCRGEVPEILRDQLVFMCQEYEKTIVPTIDHENLYFYNVGWLGINSYDDEDNDLNLNIDDLHIEPLDVNNESTPPSSPFLNIESYNDGSLFSDVKNLQIDALRKCILPPSFTASSGHNRPYTDINGSRLRKCVRCGSISAVNDDDIIKEMIGIHLQVGLWTLAFQRYCFCGSNWVKY